MLSVGGERKEKSRLEDEREEVSERVRDKHKGGEQWIREES